MDITFNPYQDEFFFSKSRFPAIIAAIGTGKTLCGLLKIFKFCEKYPDTLAMIVRKSFTDLRDSTLKDMKTYFGVEFDSNKEYKFKNGSVIMARHGDELAVLKNINLSIFLIEQAEEFEADETFVFLRDRLRRQTSPYRQGLIIANARGHNWVWKLWINGADETRTLDEATGQYAFKRKEYFATTAQTFANEHNLPADFVADLRDMATSAPNHYAQFVLNSFEEMEEDDYVFNFQELRAAQQLDFAPRLGYDHRIIGYDIARYGNDKTAAVGIQQVGALAWRVFHAEQWEKKDLDYTVGRILSTSASHNANENIIDEDGLGGGPLDFITKGRQRNDFVGFRNVPYSLSRHRFYGNERTSAAFKVKEYVSKGWLSIPDENIVQELMTLRYKYTNDGRRILISKEEMRKKGIQSPNLADALLMAASRIGEAVFREETRYAPQRNSYAEENLFDLAGVR